MWIFRRSISPLIHDIYIYNDYIIDISLVFICISYIWYIIYHNHHIYIYMHGNYILIFLGGNDHWGLSICCLIHLDPQDIQSLNLWHPCLAGKYPWWSFIPCHVSVPVTRSRAFHSYTPGVKNLVISMIHQYYEMSWKSGSVPEGHFKNWNDQSPYPLIITIWNMFSFKLVTMVAVCRSYRIPW